MNNKVNIFWFRRDLRLQDNTALFHALQSESKVIPLFIFDDDIINELPEDDPRVSFIYKNLQEIDQELKTKGSSLLIKKGKTSDVWKEIIGDVNINRVFINKDYEPYAIDRDKQIESLLDAHGIAMHTFKDQVIFEENEILNNQGLPYTIYTPYKNKWRNIYVHKEIAPKTNFHNFYQGQFEFPDIEILGFKTSRIKVKPFDLSQLDNYAMDRNFPAKDNTSLLGPHLRFGTISIRQVIRRIFPKNEVFLNELIWREFFMQILFHFPHVVDKNFRSKYDGILWENKEADFKKWCEGKTGYPMVDAGMRQLNATGYMHNRVRMVTASFLCKHLLIDWRWGEAYFAEKLLDYELSSNNGNWQWAAGTGCDAAPYFRVFNPTEQQRKFDPDFNYVHQWIPELNSSIYPTPMVEHKTARVKAIETYKSGITV